MVGNLESGHQVERWHATILKGPTIKRCHRINEQRLFLLRFSLFMLWLCFYHLWPSFPRQPPHDYWHFTKIGFLDSQILEFPRRNGQHAQNLQIPKFPQEILRNYQRWKIMPIIIGALPIGAGLNQADLERLAWWSKSHPTFRDSPQSIFF